MKLPLHERTLKVMEYAIVEARNAGSTMVRALDFVAALLGEGTGVAAQELCRARADAYAVLECRKRLSEMGSPLAKDVPISRSSVNSCIMPVAEEIATELGDTSICPIHVLLAFIRLKSYAVTVLLSHLEVNPKEFSTRLAAAYREKKAPKMMFRIKSRGKDPEGGWINITFDVSDPKIQTDLRKATDLPDGWTISALTAIASPLA